MSEPFATTTTDDDEPKSRKRPPKVFHSKYADVCRDCGAELPVGHLIRYYGPGRVYGIGCHAKPEQLEPATVRDPGEDDADRFNQGFS